MTDSEPPFICSTMLILVGDRFDPDNATRLLGVQPDRIWRKGERKTFAWPDAPIRTFESLNEQSGWKKFIGDDLKGTPCADQLNHWLEFVGRQADVLKRFRDDGVEILIDVYLSSSDSVELPPEDLERLASCGVSLSWTFYAGERTPA